MVFLAKHLDNILSIDRPTLLVICMLCAMAAWILKEYLAHPPLIVFVYPVLVLLSIVAQYTLILGEVYPPNKLDLWLMWTIMASIAGTICGVIMLAAAASLREGVARKRA